jgi:MFS family permease
MTTDAIALDVIERDSINVQRKRVGWSAFLGTVIEYYDFTLYGLLGPVVFDKLFFPKTDPMVGTLVVLSVYAVGFLGRPLGGLFFSHYGDKIGRKPMMVISMTVMGLASRRSFLSCCASCRVSRWAASRREPMCFRPRSAPTAGAAVSSLGSRPAYFSPGYWR